VYDVQIKRPGRISFSSWKVGQTVSSASFTPDRAGTYVFRDGLFKLNSGSKAKGTGVLLFFTGTGSRMERDSSSSLEISAPTSGTHAGIVIYQDRKTFSGFFSLNSDAQSKLEGTIYIPNSPIQMNSSSTMTASPFLSLIVRRLEMNSLSYLVIRNTQSSQTEGVALIQ
jgi:hypothetical protein